MENIYKKALERLQPIKLMEHAIKDMEKKSTESPELIPMHYQFICEIIKVLETFKEELSKDMIQS